MALKKLAALGLVGWIYSKGPRDPREWPAFLGEQVALLKEQAREAADAGKRANERRQHQLRARGGRGDGTGAPAASVTGGGRVVTADGVLVPSAVA